MMQSFSLIMTASLRTILYACKSLFLCFVRLFSCLVLEQAYCVCVGFAVSERAEHEATQHVC